MLNYRKLIRYVVFAALLTACIYYGFAAQQYFRLQYKTSFSRYYSLCVMLAAFITPFIIGLLLGLENWLKEKQKPGRWTMDYYRLVLLGLPFFLGALYLPLAFIFPLRIPGPLMGLIAAGTLLQPGAFISGYVMITSFKKQESGQSIEI